MSYIRNPKYIKENVIFSLPYKGSELPIVLDNQDFAYINKLNKQWYFDSNGYVKCKHKMTDGNIVECSIHEIVMALSNKNKKRVGVLHINKLPIDNRRQNLMYDTNNKETTKNLRKKKRIITLPSSSGIDIETIPTYIWYLKPNDSHGERFIVNIGNNTWKTTSSAKYSLKYKLEEAKKYLRHLKIKDPELFNEYSMNGDLNSEGSSLLNSFYNIARNGGYNLKKIRQQKNTEMLLEEDHTGLTDSEIETLQSVTFY